jgi:predicted transcriptional regulator
MAGKNRLIADFYELTVQQIMDKRVWDLPLIEEDEDIFHVLSILGGRNHIWVVTSRSDRNIKGVITEHDVLSILAPKDLPSYVFGMPDIRSLQHGTAKTAKDIMCTKIISCTPNDKILDALQKMVKYRLRRLPVLEEDKIVGELTLHQLIRKYYAATQYHPLINDENSSVEGDDNGL